MSTASTENEPVAARFVVVVAGNRAKFEFSRGATVMDVISEVCKELGIRSPSNVGLLSRSFNKLSQFDPPILSWLRLDSALIDCEIDPQDTLYLMDTDLSQFSLEDALEIRFLSVIKKPPSSVLKLPSKFIRAQTVDLLHNERICYSYDNVREMGKSEGNEDSCIVEGTLHITNYRLLMSASSPLEPSTNTTIHHVVSSIPLGGISRIRNKSKSTVDIKCTSNKRIHLLMPDCCDIDEVTNIIAEAAFDDEINCFAFSYNELDRHPLGWTVYSPLEEMQRQKVPNSKWRLYELNTEYEKIPTYPPVFAIPRTVSDEVLSEVFEHRGKSRVPALTYLHTNGGSINRCAQPKLGIRSHHCEADEFLLEQIRVTTPNSKMSDELGVLHIFDMRSKISATANRVKSGGYEHHYPNSKVHFCDIKDIHSVRHSYKAYIAACNDVSSSYYAKVCSSNWLQLIHRILATSLKVADVVAQGDSAVVHCTDGWDRTSQVCSLAQLMLDPFYRTIHGFEILIEKDWRSFGHKLSERTGHCCTGKGKRQQSPIFLQFLDCVWQVMEQYPDEFEFNESLLLCILYHSFSCRFGTFLFDSDKERKENDIHNRTVSLWSMINTNLNIYANPFYEPKQQRIQPLADVMAMKIWSNVFCFHSEYGSKCSYDRTQKLKQLLSLHAENQGLKAQVAELTSRE